MDVSLDIIRMVMGSAVFVILDVVVVMDHQIVLLVKMDMN